MAAARKSIPRSNSSVTKSLLLKPPAELACAVVLNAEDKLPPRPISSMAMAIVSPGRQPAPLNVTGLPGA
jgi:hypothetical protein